MKSGHFLEVITYQFLHSFRSLFSGLVHLFCNLLGLWFLGRKVESSLGVRRFLCVYFGAVVAGAVVQGGVALAGFMLPESMESVAGFVRDRYGDSVAGSSVGLCGVFAAYCRLQSQEETRLLLWIPVNRAILLAIAFGIAVLLAVIPTDPRLSHLAHLSGLVAGLILVGRRTVGD